MEKKINILLVDDDTLLRDTLRDKFEREPFVQAIYEAWNEQTLMQRVSDHTIDMVLLDIAIPDTNGLILFKKLRGLNKRLEVIAFTGLEGPEVIIHFLKAGVDGLVLKQEGYEELLKAVNNVRLVGAYFSKDASKIIRNNKHRWDKMPPVILKPQDIDLLRALSQGLTFDQAGEVLKMEGNSVNKFCSRLRKQLGVNNNAELMIFACNNGIL